MCLIWLLANMDVLFGQVGFGHSSPVYMTKWFVLKETSFYCQGSNLGGYREYSCSEPFSVTGPRTSLAPQRLQAKTMPRNSPFPYLSLSWSHKQISILCGMCTFRFQSHHLLKTALLSFRILGTLLPVSIQWSRNCVPFVVSQRLKPRKHTFQPEPLPPGVGSHPCST